MNILVGVLTIGALVAGVVAWRSRLELLRRLLTVAVLVLAGYMVAWMGAGIGRIPTTWVTDHPIAVIGVWSLAVLAIVGTVSVSRYRSEGHVRSIPSES
jgi:hypothetical protein